MIAGTKEEGAETPEETEFYHKMMDASSQRLKAMEGKYKGKDCIVIGNGPSINRTNLSLICNGYTFATNAFYKFTDTFNIHPHFFGLSDGKAFDVFGDEVLKIDSQLFLTRSLEIQYLRNYEHYSKIVKQEPILVRSLLPEMSESSEFSKDASEGIYSGWTVIIDLGLQLTYYFGFQRAILIGCDCCGYSESGTHFYDMKPTVCNIPVPGMASSWFHCFDICKEAWEADGREIINATVGGVLNTFPRKSLEDLYQG